jgi:hypothetical protein
MEIKSREVLKISQVQANKSYKEGTKPALEGKTFNLYQYNGIVFSVPSDNEFVQWRNDGKLYSVNFTESTRQVEDPKTGAVITVPTLQLVGCTNIAQEKAMAETDAALNYIHTQFNPAKVSENLYESLA